MERHRKGGKETETTSEEQKVDRGKSRTQANLYPGTDEETRRIRDGLGRVTCMAGHLQLARRKKSSASTEGVSKRGKQPRTMDITEGWTCYAAYPWPRQESLVYLSINRTGSAVHLPSKTAQMCIERSHPHESSRWSLRPTGVSTDRHTPSGDRFEASP